MLGNKTPVEGSEIVLGITSHKSRSQVCAAAAVSVTDSTSGVTDGGVTDCRQRLWWW